MPEFAKLVQVWFSTLLPLALWAFGGILGIVLLGIALSIVISRARPEWLLRLGTTLAKVVIRRGMVAEEGEKTLNFCQLCQMALLGMGGRGLSKITSPLTVVERVSGFPVLITFIMIALLSVLGYGLLIMWTYYQPTYQDQTAMIMAGVMLGIMGAEVLFILLCFGFVRLLAWGAKHCPIEIPKWHEEMRPRLQAPTK